MKALSLFSGIGGLDLAAEACGIETVAMCEIEEFPVSILKKRWPDVPIYDDVRKIKGSEIRGRLGAIDVVHGGFPCQDLSVAGKRAGLVCGGGYTRSGLWYEMLRIISELRPRFVVGENVRGAVSLALDEVHRGLEEEGYQVRTVLIPASSVGAPHQRERIFVLGIRGDILGIEGEYTARRTPMADCDQFLRGQGCADLGTDEASRQEPDDGDAGYCGEGSGDVGDTAGGRLQGRRVGAALSERAENAPWASHLWRTPDANCTPGAVGSDKFAERQQRGLPVTLNYQVANEESLWPTTLSRDWKGTGSGHCEKTGRNPMTNDLPSAVREVEKKNWLTVTASSNERTGSTQYKEGSMHSANPGQIDDLAERTEGNGVKGQLNPDWVEELMGYPRGWTDLDRDEPGIWMGWPARPGEPQFPYEHPRTVTGMKNRAKRLKALGNAVVPQQAEPIFRTIQFIDYMIGE